MKIWSSFSHTIPGYINCTGNQTTKAKNKNKTMQTSSSLDTPPIQLLSLKLPSPPCCEGKQKNTSAWGGTGLKIYQRENATYPCNSFVIAIFLFFYFFVICNLFTHGTLRSSFNMYLWFRIQTQPTHDAGDWNRTRATLVGGQCSHHYATPASPPLFYD